jgi:hypothetical protein
MSQASAQHAHSAMAEPASLQGYSIGVDIGGTFTDCAIVDPSPSVDVYTGKAPTTPDDRSRGFFDAIAVAGQCDWDYSLRELLAANRAHRARHDHRHECDRRAAMARGSAW